MLEDEGVLETPTPKEGEIVECYYCGKQFSFTLIAQVGDGMYYCGCSPDAMTVKHAIECLDGHDFMTVNLAKRVCKKLGVTFDDKMVMAWENRQDAWDKFGFIANKPGKDTGVDGLELSYHVTKALGLGSPGSRFSGKGYQSRANQQAIRQHLSEQGKL